jgi:hypothetical protein
MGPNFSYTDDEVTQLRAQRDVYRSRFNGIPRTIGIQDVLVLTAICAVSMQIVRWCKLPLNIVGHVYGVLLVVFICEAVLFHRTRSVAAMCFGGGMYALGFVIWYTQHDFWLDIILILWPVIYLIGAVFGLAAGVAIHGILRLLNALNSRAEVVASPGAHNIEANSTFSSDQSVINCANQLTISESKTLSAQMKWLIRAASIVDAGLFAFGSNQLFSGGVLLFPIVTTQMLGISQLCLGLAWVGFGLVVLLPPLYARNEFERGVDVLKRGGTQLAMSTSLTVLYLTGFELIDQLSRQPFSNVQWDNVIGVMTLCLFLVVVLSGLAFVAGAVVATILHESVPDLVQFAKRVATGLMRTVHPERSS